MTIGLKFTETMKGFLIAGRGPADPRHPAEYAAAEREARAAGQLVDFTITISIDDLDTFLADPVRLAAAGGTVRAAGLTAEGGAEVEGGTFNLFVETSSFYERQMRYRLPFRASDGALHVLEGFKEVKDDGHFDVWAATSTLYAVIRAGEAPGAPVVASGVLRIHLLDFLHELTTFTATGTTTEAQKAEAILRFGKSFLGTLWHVFAERRFL